MKILITSLGFTWQKDSFHNIILNLYFAEVMSSLSMGAITLSLNEDIEFAQPFSKNININ